MNVTDAIRNECLVAEEYNVGANEFQIISEVTTVRDAEYSLLR